MSQPHLGLELQQGSGLKRACHSAAHIEELMDEVQLCLFALWIGQKKPFSLFLATRNKCSTRLEGISSFLSCINLFLEAW